MAIEMQNKIEIIAFRALIIALMASAICFLMALKTSHDVSNTMKASQDLMFTWDQCRNDPSEKYVQSCDVYSNLSHETSDYVPVLEAKQSFWIECGALIALLSAAIFYCIRWMLTGKIKPLIPANWLYKK